MTSSRRIAKRRGLRWLAGLYLLLLLASHLVRSAQPELDALPPDLAAVEIVTTGDPGSVRIAYREWRPPAGEDGLAVLLLHGSPGSSRDFLALGPALAAHHRVLAPDLPGFGASSHGVPDYSIRAHALYSLDLLDNLGVERVHLLGFSMGGGVALEMYAQAPERVASLTLLSSIGVVELELLGNHQINHAIHAAQLAAIWMLSEATPHFGALDGGMLSLEYARNFYDSDQRPLRGTLSRFEPPALIVHGQNDVLVPVAAAREHHRLMPQSEIALFDTSHFMVFRGDEAMISVVDDFLSRVESGVAATRQSASSERQAQARQAFDPSVVPPATGITLLVVMGLLALATLISEDLTCIAAGLLVAQGQIGFLAATFACAFGIFAGDLLLFLAGRALGRPWVRRRPLSWVLNPEKIEASSEWFRRKGPTVIFLSRFVPGSRLPTYFTAGLLNTPFWRFLLYFGVAVLAWTPILVGIASLAGARALEWIDIFERYALVGFAASVLVVWLFVRLLRILLAPRGLLTHQGRRLLTGRVRKWMRWEFWPAWLFYFPLVLWVLWLGLRTRSFTLFTAANPAMPLGGFVGESKWDILERLPHDKTARTRRIEASAGHTEKIEAVRDLLLDFHLELPVVIKPDVGERGAGVTIARTWPEVEAALSEPCGDLLVQEYVPGIEIGVFYTRIPGDRHGSIFSITEKILPTVTGNGVSSLEDLVLADERAIMIADLYLDRFGAARHRIPEAGERVPLTDLGTHCKGAIFLDGNRFHSDKLLAAVDDIGRSYAGFFFGRFDLRSANETALRAGRFTIIELNGVTSEATSIYDPANSLADAYKVLFRQWRLAFETGRRNVERGARAANMSELFRAILRR